MNWAAIIVSVAKLILVFISTWTERDKDRRERKARALKDLTNGIKEKDVAKITAAYDYARRA
jgi:hypothetical protein